MSDAKELEIRLQFLDEALDYLSDIDAVLIGIADTKVDLSNVNSALRAAHSIKGGASVMGFTTLSELSHRLEDALKVLKLQNDSLSITAEIERLLLGAIDCISTVVKQNRQRKRANQEWLRSHALPIFDQIQALLGEPQEEDANSILMMEEEQDIVVLLFQTEVEGCLQRLEAAIETNSSCLQEEVEILAQELGGLAEMMQLNAFGQLCQSIEHAFATYPNRIQEIASSALDAWRRSQALVITHQLDELPTTLNISKEIGLAAIDLSDTASFDDFQLLIQPIEDQRSNNGSSDDSRVESHPSEHPILDAPLSENQSFEAAIADLEFELDSDPQHEQASVDTPDQAIESLETAMEDLNISQAPQHEYIPVEDSNSSDERVETINLDVELERSTTASNGHSSPLSDASHPSSPFEVTEPLKAAIANVDHEAESTLEAIVEANTRSVTDVSESAIADIELDLEQSLTDLLDPQSASIPDSPSYLIESKDIPESSRPFQDKASLHTVAHEETPESSEPFQEATSVKFDVAEDAASSSSSVAAESTVRVPVKQLNQLSDLLGELIIERNRLNLEVKTLQTLIQSLTHRSQTLNQANTKLRTVYDTVATQTVSNLKPSDAQIQQEFQMKFASDEDANGQSGLTRPILNSLDESDAHMDDFDGLEMDRYGSLHSMFQEIMETVVQIQEVTGDINVGLDDTSQTTRELNKTTRQLQSSLTQLRMRPLSDIVGRFPRALRELSLQYNKPVQLQIYGGSTLVDRNVLEALNEPLLQLIRNAFDHGIEVPETRRAAGKPAEGVIEIRAFHRNNRTIIVIRDDGRGISLEKVRSRALQMGLDESLLNVARQDELLSLIFEPGFSTADKVTALSGRGVGMDIVRNKLKQIRGEIKVDTQSGRGTTFTIAVPFTLSVARVLLAESNHMMLAFPIDVIEEMIPMPQDHILTALGSETFDWQGNMVQLIRLSHWLKFNTIHERETPVTPPKIDVPTILMVTHNNQLIGVQVDRCWGEQEVAIRKVEGDLPLPTGFNNCTILGDGRVVPLVNIPELLHWVISYDRSGGDELSQNLLRDDPNQIRREGELYRSLKHLPSFEPSLPTTIKDKSTVMVVDDSINVRRLLALTLEKAGYRVIQAKDGQDALEKLAEGVSVHAIICDIEMPRLDGYGFLVKSKASAKLRELPVVMLTSRSGQKHRLLAKSLGASAYFSKPYNERSLLQTLEDLVDRDSTSQREIPLSVN